MMMRLVPLMLLLPLAALAQEPPARVPSPGENLARGKSCTFTPPPSYDLCTDPGDATDLTDGLYNGCEWREKGTVGWGVYRNKVFLIDLDLGAEQPLGKLTFDSVTGGAQVTFPSAVMAFVSSDGKDYRYLGDVMTEAPSQEEFLNHRFELDGLKGFGRYVRLAVLPGGFYLFCDEIEVMKGTHGAAEATYADAKAIPDAEVAQYAVDRAPWVQQKNATLTLLRYAAEGVEERYILGATLTTRDSCKKAVEKARQELLAATRLEEPNLLQGPPYRSFDRKAFAAIGAMNHAEWPDSPVQLWGDDGWTWLKPTAVPLGKAAEVCLDMMNNEWASGWFNVGSCSDQPQDLTLSVADFTGPDKLPAAQVLSLGQVVHVEAMGYNYRDDAIMPLAMGQKFSLPAGLSRRIWLTFKTRGLDLKPGAYTTSIAVSSNGKRVAQVPVRLQVRPLRFPDRPTLQSNSWGYFNEEVIVGREPEAAQNLLDHYNTSLVLNHSYLPYPKPDNEGNLTEPLDFTKLDQMLAWNPQCRFWLIWAGFEFGFDRLGLQQFGGPVWEKVFTQWVTQVRDHLLEKGLTRQQFAWYWIDEPGDKVWNERCVPASKLLKQIDPEMLCWENPTDKVSPQMLEEALPYFDLYCPSTGGIVNRQYVDVCRKTRLPSWVYACASEKNSNPFGYYRWFAWNAFKLGFGGIGMWVYVDANSKTLSDYTGGTSYALIYGSPQGLVNSKRWEAWRQGIADYEYLCMLRDAVAKAKQADKPHPELKTAETILSEGLASVVGEDFYNGDPALAARPDELRLQILDCLEALR